MSRDSVRRVSWRVLKINYCDFVYQTNSVRVEGKSALKAWHFNGFFSAHNLSAFLCLTQLGNPHRSDASPLKVHIAIAYTL